MGWAKDSFERELARSGIFPINYSSEGGNNRPTTSNKPKKRYREYFQYDFPTDAQVRALNFITTYTGLIFEGSTKGEAREFISEYLDYAKEEKENE